VFLTLLSRRRTLLNEPDHHRLRLVYRFQQPCKVTCSSPYSNVEDDLKLDIADCCHTRTSGVVVRVDPAAPPAVAPAAGLATR